MDCTSVETFCDCAYSFAESCTVPTSSARAASVPTDMARTPDKAVERSCAYSLENDSMTCCTASRGAMPSRISWISVWYALRRSSSRPLAVASNRARS